VEELKDKLWVKIKTLSETIWENKSKRPQVDNWLENFANETNNSLSESLHALYLLSQFMYFGIREFRELLKALYRDMFKYPIVESIRKTNNNTTNIDLMSKAFKDELDKTRFLGVGNPSESGCLLLYLFRQVNGLSRDLFIHSHEIFKRNSSTSRFAMHFPNVKRYVFIDDFCGSARQAKEYSKNLIEQIKAINNNAHVAYYVLFSTKSGLEKIRNSTSFDEAKSLFEMDDSYKCFDNESRYFLKEFLKKYPVINKDFAQDLCYRYGKDLCPSHPLGYEDGQLLIGFWHNTPDNTLPIIWFERHPGDSGRQWESIFKRYPKIY